VSFFVLFFKKLFEMALLKKKKYRDAASELDVSIGTQSLMHPVDWLEVNKNNGLHQALPDFNETTWFECGDLSILKTPQYRKSYPRRPLLLDNTSERGEEDAESGYVVHSVETDLTFCLEVLMGIKRAAVLHTHENQAQGGGQTPWPGSCDAFPFSTIKKESGGHGVLNRSLTRSKRSLFAVDVPRGSVEDDESDELSFEVL
jgi:hypothetical protein